MKKFFRLLIFILNLLLFFISSSNASDLVNPFTVSGNWYKANLHTHTTLSDGDVNLAVRVEQYRQKGYHVLAVTDHEKTNNVEGYSDSNFLLLSGMETHPASNSPVPYHLVCLNIPYGLQFAPEVNAIERICQVKAVGGEVIFAHPYWSGHTINDMLAIDGYIAVEVYNGRALYTGKGYSSVHWDELINAGRIIPAIAVDDLHYSEYIGQSWVMIKANELTPDAIMNALRTGCFYSSCGPEFKDFRIVDGNVVVECSPVVEICFMGQHTLSYNKTTTADNLITSASCKIPKEARWVRAEIVDANGRHAWTNPIVIKEQRKNSN